MRSYSVEIMLILLAFKLAMPEHFFLSRGNHEVGQGTYSNLFQGDAHGSRQVLDYYKLLFVATFLWYVYFHVVDMRWV